MLHDLHGQRRGVGRYQRACEAALVAVGEELVPHDGAPRLVLAHAVVVGERVAEEVGAVDAAVDRGRLVLVHHHREDDRNGRVHAEAHRHALVGLDDLVVLLDPVSGVLGLDEGEGERADAVARGELDRLAPAAGDPERRVRLLERLGDHVARRHAPELAVPAGERLLDEHASDRAHGVLPHLALARAVDQEAAQLGRRGRLTRAELHSPVRDQVERGDPLRHPRRVVHGRRDLDDAVAQPDALRCAPPRRPGTPRARTSASTPRGSGARPPRRSRTRAGRPAPPGRARPSGERAPSAPAPRAAGSDARRRSQSAFAGARFSQAAAPVCPMFLGGARHGESPLRQVRCRQGRSAKRCCAWPRPRRARTTSRRCSRWRPRRPARRSARPRSR